MKVLVIGAVMCDVSFSPIYKDAPERFFNPSDKFSIHGGGEGNNASMDLAILGNDVKLVSRAGKDFIGDYLMGKLNEAGVDTSNVIRMEEEPTTVSVQMLTDKGERTLAAKRWGANEKMSMGDVPDELIEWADHVHIVNAMCLSGLDGEGTAEIFRKAKVLGKTTSMDLNNPRREGPCFELYEQALYNCDVFTPSGYEIERSVGLTDMNEIREFYSRYGIKVLAVKRSELGCYITDFKDEAYLPTLVEGDPVDVVGAGDAFSSTFATAWKMGYDMRSAGLIASAASEHVCTTHGTTQGMRSFEELAAFVNARGYETARPEEKR